MKRRLPSIVLRGSSNKTTESSLIAIHVHKNIPQIILNMRFHVGSNKNPIDVATNKGKEHITLGIVTNALPTWAKCNERHMANR